ncbi:MAG TPA: hypothetical protein DCX07_16115, partial [Phycisphaerales bacterium]|nr:hypothetical protein [Phycisphaerales bacterium]
MKRRLMLLAGTFVALMGAFLTYRFFSPTAGVDQQGQPPEIALSHPATQPKGATDMPEVQNPEIIQRDDQGHLRAIYKASRMLRTGRDEVRLDRPDVMLYLKDNQRIYIRADSGQMEGEEIANGFNFRRGRLSGNVTLLFDRPEFGETRPPEERMEDLVRIFMGEVDFDNERLTIRSEGAVTVFSPEVDIRGRGLLIRWNTAPRELQLFRIDEGDMMIVKQVPEEYATFSLPGGPGAASQGEGEATTASAPASHPATASSPATRAAPTAIALDLRTTEPASQPATTSAPAGGMRTEPLNVYRAEFHDRVNVDHGQQHMHGADVLRLTFEWSGREDRLRRKTTKTSPTAVTSQSEEPTSASAPATEPATQPAREPMKITWFGPLVVQPVEYTPEPDQKRYRIGAEGDRIAMTDGRVSADCTAFEFLSPEQTGHLSGTDKTPIRLAMENGEEVVSEKIAFDRRAGTARLTGRGYMLRPPAQATTQPATAPSGDRISWTDSVAVQFVETRQGDRARQEIRNARFLGGVELLEGRTGDFVRCDDLDVTMAPGVSGGRTYPARAMARGHVTARQEGSDIEADKVTMTFAPAGEGEAARARPATVLAEGHVKIRDLRGKEPTIATADRVDADVEARTAKLTGKEATIRQGPNSLVGGQIELNEKDESAVVVGPGRLSFLTRKDLNGQDLPQPREITVAWSRGMGYGNKNNAAAFTGDVDLVSGPDRMQCETMQIWMERTESATQPAQTQPAGERDRRLALNLENYSGRRLAMIKAKGAVRVQSRREDPDKRFLRLQLTGEELLYDASRREMTVPSPGTLVVEDYRLPKEGATTRPADATPAGEMAGAIVRPWQTLFQWNRLMELKQAERQAIMEGEAIMVHRSGRQIVASLEELGLPDWPKDLEEGRRTRLTCERLLAQFSPADAGILDVQLPAALGGVGRTELR